jgi:hypothetical protein
MYRFLDLGSQTVNRPPLQRVRTVRRFGPVETSGLPERQRARTKALEVRYQVLSGLRGKLRASIHRLVPMAIERGSADPL